VFIVSVALEHCCSPHVTICACRQSPYLRQVPAATNVAILIMMSFATECLSYGLPYIIGQTIYFCLVISIFYLLFLFLA